MFLTTKPFKVIVDKTSLGLKCTGWQRLPNFGLRVHFDRQYACLMLLEIGQICILALKIFSGSAKNISTD